MISKALPYLVSFLGALVLTLILTPIVREVNRKLGMVDRPDPRRINKVPVPRGGGLAILLGVFVSYWLFLLAFDRPGMQGLGDARFFKMCALSFAIAGLGLADDRFSLAPKLKLLGQLGDINHHHFATVNVQYFIRKMDLMLILCIRFRINKERSLIIQQLR